MSEVVTMKIGDFTIDICQNESYGLVEIVVYDDVTMDYVPSNLFYINSCYGPEDEEVSVFVETFEELSLAIKGVEELYSVDKELGVARHV